MFGLALRRAAKVESGYVCLPCLFKRLDLPTRHLVRYQTTTPQGIAVASKGELVVENDPKKKSSKEKVRDLHSLLARASGKTDIS